MWSLRPSQGAEDGHAPRESADEPPTREWTVTQDQLVELSRFLYSPVTLLLYVAATIANFYSLATQTALSPSPARTAVRASQRPVQRLGVALAILAVASHVVHVVVRALAQQRWPLGNMFEFTSAMALVCAAAGLIYLLGVRKRQELLGFVMLVASLLVGSAMLVYSSPGPLQPILATWWLPFHVTVIASAAGILTVGFVFSALYLMRDLAERRVAGARSAVTHGSTVGAVHASGVSRDDVAGRVSPDVIDGGHSPVETEQANEAAYRVALRAAISPWRLAVSTFVGVSAVSWIYIATPTLDTMTGFTRFLAINVGLVGAALLARWFMPYLPDASTLDALAYRIISLGFLTWTFGVIAGAMWAEQSWGRFWGWDPKETGSFVTWVAYASYLHARATPGVRGRTAGWIGLWAFAVLMFAYQGVNLVMSSIHGYAGLPQ